MKCQKCGKEFEGKFCPECGEPSAQTVSQQETAKALGETTQKPKKKKMGKGCLIAVCVVLALAIIGAIAGGGATETPSSASEPDSTVQSTVVSSQNEETESAFANETTGQKNAREAAANYLSFMAFSHDGLIQQLEYEGYTTEEATYAADNCGADWNEQALKSAKTYLNNMAFSYTGLIEQLKYEKFTDEQATYGADNCGADWNEQAAKCAETYLNTMSFSRESLIDQLVYEGFTQEQAEYGVSQNGY